MGRVSGGAIIGCASTSSTVISSRELRVRVQASVEGVLGRDHREVLAGVEPYSSMWSRAITP